MGFNPPPSSLPPGSKVWSYYRDSGGNKQELSIDQQQESITAYCKEYGLLLVREFADVGKSGRSLKGRDAFIDMRELASNKKIRADGLLIWNYARFGRNLKESRKQIIYFEDLMVVHPLNGSVLDNDFNPIMQDFELLSSQAESDRKSIDVKRGLAYAVKMGFSGGGFPPCGYIRKLVAKGTFRDGLPRMTSIWIPDPELSSLVLKAFELRAEGRSYQEITEATAGRLYQLDVSWHDFFRNKTYIGTWGRDEKTQVKNHHEAIVPVDLFEKVQEINKKRRYIVKDSEYHPRRIKYPSLLSGLAHCIHCGSMMSKEYGGRNRWSYYVCSAKKRGVWSDCVGRMINQKEVDALVLDVVFNQILTYDYFQILLDETRARLNNSGDLDGEIKSTNESITAVERKISNLRRAVEAGGENAVVWLREREVELARLRVSLAESERRKVAKSFKVSPAAVNLVLDYWRGQLEEVKGSGDVRAVKGLLSRFVEGIGLGYNQIVIRYTYPINDLEVNNSDQFGGISPITCLFLPSREFEITWR